MKNIIIGIGIGILLSTAIFVPIRRQTIESYRAVGINNGKIAAFSEAAQAIEREFGIYDGKSAYKKLFSVKTTDVIAIDKPDKKSIRVIR